MSEAVKKRIPVNIDDIRERLKAKPANPDLGKENSAERDKLRRLKAAKERAREAEQSKEELAAQLEAIRAELEETKSAREAAEKKAAEYEPSAKQWKDHEHKERHLLLEKLPAEFKTEAKDLPLKALRTFVKGIAPESGRQSTPGVVDRSKMTDEDLAKLAESDPDAFLKAIETPKSK